MGLRVRRTSIYMATSPWTRVGERFVAPGFHRPAGHAGVVSSGGLYLGSPVFCSFSASLVGRNPTRGIVRRSLFPSNPRLYLRAVPG